MRRGSANADALSLPALKNGVSRAKLMNLFQNASQHLFTVRDCVRFGVSQFQRAELYFGHGTTSAWEEACYLASFALKLPLPQMADFLEARLLPEEREAVLSLYEARTQTRKPAAYLTQEAWLGDFRFYVDERVIVPRSFIAEILRDDTLSAWISDPDQVHHVLDLCTGSACLAILAAHTFAFATVDAVDISPTALEVATLNIQTYGLDDQITPVQSDAFTQLSGRCYDVILSNPPYVDGAAMRSLPHEYRHEPELALAGGEDGLELVHEILQQAADHLTEKGILVVEIGHNRALLEVLYPELPFKWLNTSSGDEFVFLLTKEALVNYFSTDFSL